MSTSYSPCAACKCLRRKCTNECVFAPYFPPDNPQKFTNVHKVFGASNVAKLLNELNANQREDAVNSLAYEAEYRLKDPVYGCVGLVAILQQQLKKINQEIDLAKKELATYIGPAAMQPMSNLLQQMQQQQQQQQLQNMMPYHVQQQMMLQMGPPRGAGGPLVIREPQQQQQQQQQQMLLQQQQQQQQMLEAQQLAAIASAREREMLQIRAYEQQQQQQLLLQQNELMRFHDGIVNIVDDGAGPSTATGFNQMMPPAEASSSGMLEPSLALGGGSYDVTNPHSHSQSHSQYSHPHELIQLQLQQQQEYLLQHQQQQLLATQQQLQMQQALQQLSQPQASNSQQQQQQIQIENSDDARSIDPS